MARDRYYPEYDWRGIAMLTQQLGQLFEPSKARLMSQQQEHEMNMLMAKKAWDTQSKQLETLKDEYDTLTTTFETARRKVEILGGKDLVNAGMKDGANPNQAADIHDKLDIKNLGDMNDMSNKYIEMINNTKSNLRNMVLYNDTAKVGENWSDELTARPAETRKDIRGKDYKALHDADKSGTLSWAEQNNALKDYIRDYYAVPEGQDGMEITIGNEILTATPEALAFLAGFRHVRDRKGVDAAEAAAQVSKLKTNEQYLNTMYMARNTIQDYEQRGMSKQKLALRKGSPYADFTSADVDIYSSSHDMFKEAYKAYIKKGGIIPDDLVGTNPVNSSMFFNDPEAYYFTEPKEFTEEGLTPEVYTKIQGSDNDIYKQMAFNIVYNWEDIMKSGGDTEKANMLKSFELLKTQYNF